MDLERAEGGPLFARIAGALADDIARGRLHPGARLPGSRRLASELGVHRNTVVAAFEELVAQGWIRSDPSRGSFVCDDLPDRSSPALRHQTRGRSHVPRRTAYELGPDAWGEPAVSPPTRRIAMGGGMPDPRMAPRVLLARAYRRAMQQHGAPGLDYADSHGHHRLREALADMLSTTRAVAAEADDILITRGSQMALWLIGQVLADSESVVGVESFGYRPAWEALSLAGATLQPFEVDARGIDVDAIAGWLDAGQRLRALYLTPHHQYPTTATLAPERRARLLELARRHRFAIIEDDYDNEFHYEGRPVLPMASVDSAGSVIYVGTLSKVLAPGIRVGWVVAPRPLLRRMAALRSRIDRQGDHVLQAAVAELMEDGEVQRHVWRMKRSYAKRREVLCQALAAQLGERLHFDPPSGGMAMWVHAPGIDLRGWQRACAERGVDISIAAQYAHDGRQRPWLRLGFARATPEELRQGVDVMAETLGPRLR